LAYWDDEEEHQMCEVSPSLYQRLHCLVLLDSGAKYDPPLHDVPNICITCNDVALEFLDGALSHIHLFDACRFRNLDAKCPETAESLYELTLTLRKSQYPSFRLSRLLLPTAFSSSPLHPALKSAMEDLSQTCDERGVEIVFEDGEEKLGGSFLPLSTVEYAKELRAERIKGENA
jgi:hypothetical protein